MLFTGIAQNVKKLGKLFDVNEMSSSFKNVIIRLSNTVDFNYTRYIPFLFLPAGGTIKIQKNPMLKRSVC